VIQAVPKPRALAARHRLKQAAPQERICSHSGAAGLGVTREMTATTVGARSRRVRSVSSRAAEDIKEAAVGAAVNGAKPAPFENAEISAFLRRCSGELLQAKLPEKVGISGNAVAKDAAASLNELASELEGKGGPLRLEDLERHLNVLEQKLLAVLLTATPDLDLIAVRAEADREIAPYRRKMSGAQLEQLHKQYLHKRLLERYKLPRLSLFYM